MDERTVIISSRELVDHAVMTRKRSELEFKKDLLVRSGAKEDDLHVKAIGEEIAAVEAKLSPIAEKLSVADMLTAIPSRKEIGELTEFINKHSRQELEASVKSKSGTAYELMKKRAALVKANFEKREDIARLAICLNTMPRKEAEELRGLIEEGQGEDVDVSFLPRERQQELVNLASRIGRQCCVFSGSFSVDKKKAETCELRPQDEVTRTLAGGRQVWVNATTIAEFEENEKVLGGLLAKIQSKGAEKQARNLTEEETAYFEKLQHEYLEALKKRSQFAAGMELKETAKVYRKGLPPAQKESEY